MAPQSPDRRRARRRALASLKRAEKVLWEIRYGGPACQIIGVLNAAEYAMRTSLPWHQRLQFAQRVLRDWPGASEAQSELVSELARILALDKPDKRTTTMEESEWLRRQLGQLNDGGDPGNL